jgi:two-component system chemotaxis sensor kinase CheA
VLVVDDQFTVRELQRSILEAAGYEVATARDGREALAAVSRDASIELVVTDIEMPELDGYALLQSIRARDHNASLPVVIVTSQGSDEDRRRGAALGADAYIVKEEFNQQALLETVRRLVGR